ncbi:mitochondrial coenzyme A diphosphatase NUDT8-like [Cydia fagiglandana]|uniref:mitochondrial coenzyme A diphosphatase NUDT8-like n=1 Tax=Cydia fagiglandana TaxID=1458189 RepID=UPI002FEE1BAF
MFRLWTAKYEFIITILCVVQVMLKSLIMSLSPQTLLSAATRQRCVSKLKELPSLVVNDEKASESASVLVPLCVHEGQVCLLYTLRSSNLKNHSGQVSFPGGKADANETNIDTALRETEEEIGIPRDSVYIWGSMPRVQGRNKNLAINPIVGEIRNFDINKLRENPDEVEEVFLVPMQAFCDSSNHAHWVWKGMQLPMFLYGRHKIWGITGAITHMFLNCLLPENEFKGGFSRKKFELEELMNSKL